MPTSNVQHKRGATANLPTSNLNAGEIYFTTDEHALHVPTDGTTMVPVVTNTALLNTLPAIDVSNDLVQIWDASETTTPKQKKVTVQALKTAFNIPASSTDEKVAVVTGGTAGTLYGTNGADGVLRVSSNMSITKDAGNAFMTLAVTNIDCGTF